MLSCGAACTLVCIIAQESAPRNDNPKEDERMSHKEDVFARLAALGVPFERHEHEAVHTMQECLAMPWALPDVTFCKNILLCNRQKTEIRLYVTDPEKPFRTADVSKALGVSRLSFAPAETLPELLGLESGSLSPLALWFDPTQRVQLVFDRIIRREGRIAFHPCDSTATVIFDQDVFFGSVVPSLGHKPVWLATPWPGEDR